MMKYNYLHDIFIVLYVDKRDITPIKIIRYIKIIRVYALKGIIDNTLAYNLTFKLLECLRAVYIESFKNDK